MMRRDTIAAIATPSGVGGVAIVRVSGPEACDVAKRVFRGFPASGPESHRLYVGSIESVTDGVIDRGMAVVMASPRSYTGEDVAEIHCHGGALLARSVLAAALAAGARPAERGEFTLRAFLNGRIDLAQAESVADLVSARTPAALRAAVHQLAGGLSEAVEALRTALVGVAARLEVAIDFSEEDVGDLDRPVLAGECDSIADRIRVLAASFRHGRILRDGVRVAIVGKPNVGKSSLLNRLLGADRAIVTPTPGTTRDSIEELAEVGGVALVLVDTAGLRSGNDEVERLGIARSRREIETADVTLVVLDGSRELDDDDDAVLDATQQTERIILINKEDLPLRLGERLALREPTIRISALTGSGLEQLGTAVLDRLGSRRLSESTVVVTRERHFTALGHAAARVDGAATALRVGDPPELAAVEVMAALDHLGEITGRTSPEAILDRVFSEFCIGK